MPLILALNFLPSSCSRCYFSFTMLFPLKSPLLSTSFLKIILRIVYISSNGPLISTLLMFSNCSVYLLTSAWLSLLSFVLFLSFYLRLPFYCFNFRKSISFFPGWDHPFLFFFLFLSKNLVYLSSSTTYYNYQRYIFFYSLSINYSFDWAFVFCSTKPIIALSHLINYKPLIEILIDFSWVSVSDPSNLADNETILHWVALQSSGTSI